LFVYLLMGAAYVVGGALVGGGFYIARRDHFPSWWQHWMLWPLVRVTPRVTHFQGWAFVALGASILAIGFTPLVPETVGGVLVLLALGSYVAGVALFAYSTYLSRRRTAS
jgi:hypothetical protein